jgi:predicted amino acid-binding ACT domain protein
VATYALSAVGRDRPGIVAAVAEALVVDGVNVEDS